MLTPAKLGRWSVSYYVDTARDATAAARDARARNGGLGEYYSESETRMPTWLVAGEEPIRAAELVGLTRGDALGGAADLDVVTRWLDDGMVPSREVGRAFRAGSVHGFDLTFCAPKSVSLLRAFGDDVTDKAVADAHAYAIGEAAPVGLFVETFGTEKTDPEVIRKAIAETFDLRPLAIIRDLDLLRPIYSQTAAYGHFGRTEAAGYDNPFPWEQTTKVEALQAAARA